MERVKFKHWNTVVKYGMYGNQRLAIQLFDEFPDFNQGQSIATASVNLPDVPMDPDEVAIKDWTENEGMLDALVNSGIVHPPHRREPTGFVTAPVCRIKSKAALAMINKLSEAK